MENLQNKIQNLLNLYKSKKLIEAEKVAKNLIKVNPRVAFLYNLLGLILSAQKKTDEAMKYYKEGIKADPSYAMNYNNLGIIYRDKNDNNSAELYYKKAIGLDKNITESYNNLGNLYSSEDKHQEAIKYYNKAININPKFFIGHYNLSLTFKSLGEFLKAKKYLEETIKLNPHFYSAHRNLSQLIKYTEENKHFKILRDLYSDKKINQSLKTELAFALGKAFEDIKDFKKAFECYVSGNDSRRKKIKFSIEEEKKEFSDIKRTFNDSVFYDQNSTSYKCTPIFIIGMPRSGTTLIEQIISNHPQVYGADELNFLPNLIEKYFEHKKINRNDFKKIADEYIHKVKNISNNSKYVTDKLPINFKWIGLIKLALPNSRIIHCVRNAKDNCFSIFKNYFANPRLNFAYDLSEVSEYYIMYKDLMNHWNSLLPDYILDIKYEEVIQNPEKKIRSLLKFCNLSWNKNCLKFYNNKRAIKTASDTQARKKIYKTSINSWKNFETEVNNFFLKLPN